LKFYLPIIFLFLNSSILPQWDSSYIDEDEAIEALIQEQEEESDNSAAYEVIEEQLTNPVNLNTAEIPELLSIPYLDLNTANKILEHRQKFGPFFSANELYSIKEISPETISKILPFLVVIYHEKEIEKEQDFFGSVDGSSDLKIRSRAAKDLQTRKAYKENKFNGSDYKYYNRFIGEYQQKYQFGFLTEKDPGENSFNEFTSFFLSAKDLGVVKNLIVGDYTIESGQGITLWSGYGFSKGSEAVYPLKKYGKNIAAYKSTDENRFFRGAAGEIMFGDFSFTAFYSNNKLDANIDSTNLSISSTPLTGLHRTDNEQLKRKTVEEAVIGGKADYSFKFKRPEIYFNLGALYFNSKFSHPFLWSNIYDINGNRFNYSSIYYDFYYQPVNLFGELSYNGISAASINGLIISITKDFSFITSIRSYPRNYYTLHGSALAEASERNEVGFYNGIRWKTKIGSINFYYDQFKFPYAGYGFPLPTEGKEFLVSLQSKPLPKFETRIKIKHEDKETAGNLNLSKVIVNQIKKSLRLDLIYNVSKEIRIKGRFEINNFNIEDLNINEQGMLFYQDLRVALFSKVTISARIAFFKTDSFNSAVYVYETDLQGVSSNPAMYGEGVKWYFLFRYKLLKSIAVSFKYSELYKPGEKYLYSGDEKIEGNIDNKLSLQLDFNF
jgi:hypothetical protein